MLHARCEAVLSVLQTRKEAVLAQRRLALDALFEKCDNEGSGLLERGELERALSRYKEGAEGGAISRGEARRGFRGRAFYLRFSLSFTLTGVSMLVSLVSCSLE